MNGWQCPGSSLPFLLLSFDSFPDFCQLIVYHVLLSQHISPKLSYFCFELFSWRDDLIVRIIFSHSCMFTIFSCSLEAFFWSYICYSFLLPIFFHYFAVLFYNSCTIFFYLYVVVPILFLNVMGFPWVNYLRKFLVIDQSSVSA